MKIIVAVLEGLLLAGIPIFCQELCRKEEQTAYYYIYNASVEVNSYYCLYNYKQRSDCRNSHAGKIIENVPSDVVHNCRVSFLKWLLGGHVNFCELSASVNLATSIIKLSDNTSCLYFEGTCYRSIYSKTVFWSTNISCRNLILIGYGNFSTWTDSQNQSVYIENEYNNVILKKTLKLCDYNVWTTNHPTVIVSKTQFGGTNFMYRNIPQFQDSLPNVCENKNNTNVGTNITLRDDITKMWYVYKFPINITTHMCFTNPERSCENMNLSQVNPEDKSRLFNRCSSLCDTSPCNFDQSKTEICTTTMQFDIEKDSLRELPECKYSTGFCKQLKSFWLYTNQCDNIQKAYKGYEEECAVTKCLTQNDNSDRLVLLREGKLCGENVWYINQDGFVASKKELFVSISGTDKELSLLVSQQNQDIRNLQILLHYLLLLVLFCVLWYIFNVIVNFISLRKLKKMRSAEEKVHLINCVSQSLTTRHLYFNQGENKIPNDVQELHLYQSVDNQYNK